MKIFNPLKNYVKIPGYHDLISRNRSNSNYGGVGLYIKSNYSFSLIDSLNNLVLKKLELLAVKIELGEKYVNVISTYRPPNSSLSDTMEDLDKIFEKIGHHNTIISGDFNICLDKQDSIQKKFLGKIFENNFEQIVESSTRYTSTSSSCIDNIITNITEAKAHVTFHSLSDHQVILCLWEKKLNKSILREAKKCNQINVKKVHYANAMDKIKEFNSTS